MPTTKGMAVAQSASSVVGLDTPKQSAHGRAPKRRPDENAMSVARVVILAASALGSKMAGEDNQNSGTPKVRVIVV